MTVDLLRNFERVAGVPGTIPQLRNFVLNLAMRGRLLRQEPADEPASELLATIARTRRERLRGGLIRASRADYGDIAAGDDFPLPPRWARTNINESCDLMTGATPDRGRAEYFGGDVPWLVSGDINQEQIFACEGRITKLGMASSNCKLLPPDSVLMALNGQGKTRATVALLRIPATCNQSLVAITPLRPDCLLPEYLFWNLRSRYLPLRHLTGHGDRRGLNMKIISCLTVSVPPIVEQHRIVAKVDELMGLLDRLEAAQDEREERRDELRGASLHGLIASDGGGAPSARDVQLVLDRSSRLITKPDHVAAVRQTILDLAMLGRLLPHERISKWASLERWQPLRDVLDLVTDGDHATPPRVERNEDAVPLVTAKNVRNGVMDFSVTDWVSKATAARSWQRCRPVVGDILMVCVGATIGRLCILRQAKDMVLVRSVALLRPNDKALVDFLAYCLRSPILQSQMWRAVKTTGQPCLYLGRIQELTVPLPPPAEQSRIVAKVDELMELCDDLEAALESAHQGRVRLLEALLRKALDDGPVPLSVGVGGG